MQILILGKIDYLNFLFPNLNEDRNDEYKKYKSGDRKFDLCFGIHDVFLLVEDIIYSSAIGVHNLIIPS